MRIPRFRGRNRCNRSRPGTAVVELAVVLPLMMMIGLLTIDFGRAVTVYLVLSSAARAGADYGSTHSYTTISRPAWENRITSAVQLEMANFKRYDSSQLHLGIFTESNQDGTTQVAVDVRYSLQTIVPWPGVPSRVPLHYRVETRRYQ